MRTRSAALSFVFLLSCICMLLAGARVTAASFTRLETIPGPTIIASTEAFPGGRHGAANLLDGNPATDYASDNKGTNTVVEFDFAGPKAIAAFRHVDRDDPATVAASELIFLDAKTNVLLSLPVTHLNQRAGVTFFVLPTPVTAQRVRWHITAVGGGLNTVGGAEVSFFTTGLAETAPTNLVLEAQAPDLLERKTDGLRRPLRVTVDYPYIELLEANVATEGAETNAIQLKPGTQSIMLDVPAAESEIQLTLKVQGAGQTLVSRTIALKPVRQWEIFILPHSHVDIGYTALQGDVEQKQNSNIETGLRLARATANYPEGARFKWNVEVLWPVDNYLRDVTPEKRTNFIAAVRSGQIGLDAFYGNILTGLCRPEELLQSMRYATLLSEMCGVPIESAMISDVPGYTWSTVSAMAQAGVKYFSFAPNYFDRMGGTMKEWQNRPFWWLGPDGRSRVLCWCPSRGYALGHLIGDGDALARFIPNYLVELETNSYPYDITYLRWNVHGDNGSPDEKVADVVRDWNTRYVYPHLRISTTSEAFRQFERRYGGILSEFKGDYTPYWEDGAASSALETAMNRASAERLVQTEALWAMRRLPGFPGPEFQAAWRNVLLYSEHTWGAHNSISQPDLPFVRDQWKVKQGFALDADKQSRELLLRAGILAGAPEEPGTLDVFNTCSWTRTDLVTVSAEDSGAGDRVLDAHGRMTPSQRLSTGELVFLARDVPAFAASRYRVVPGSCPPTGHLMIRPPRLRSPEFFVLLDERTGAIRDIFSTSSRRELVNTNAPTEINDFFYLPGSDLKGLQRNGVPHFTVKENGPLVGSVLIESDAPGCKRLLREVRLIDGLDRIEIINTVDKLPVRAKEGLHFGYGFSVPRGVVRMDVGWAQVRPEMDQIPAACKNWFSVQRWVDVSNHRYGVTWAPLDAPLVEVGSVTANLVGSQTDYRAWIQQLEPSSTLYSWVMNNHWHTNYRADQEGATVFRYAVRGHKIFAPEDAARFGIACSQPLIAVRASGQLKNNSFVRVSSDGVLVPTLKRTDDDKGWLVRLFGASGKTEKVRLAWASPAPHQLWLSDTSEQPRRQIHGSIEVPGWAIVTLRAE